MKISHRGGPKITFSYPFVHLYKSYNSSKVPAMPCHESSLMILTAPHKPGRMHTAERGPHAHRGEVGEGGGGPRGRGEVGEARRVCQARAGAGHLHAAKARSTSGLSRRSVGGSVGGRQSLARGRACPRSPCLPPKLASTAVHRGPGDHMIREKQAQKCSQEHRGCPKKGTFEVFHSCSLVSAMLSLRIVSFRRS